MCIRDRLIDRAGVALGLPFPSGPHLEKLARSSDSGDFSRVRLDGLFFSFSGVENQFRAALEHGKAPEDVARFVLNTVVQTCLLYTSTMCIRMGFCVNDF